MKGNQCKSCSVEIRLKQALHPTRGAWRGSTSVHIVRSPLDLKASVVRLWASNVYYATTDLTHTKNKATTEINKSYY